MLVAEFLCSRKESWRPKSRSALINRMVSLLPRQQRQQKVFLSPRFCPLAATFQELNKNLRIYSVGPIFNFAAVVLPGILICVSQVSQKNALSSSLTVPVQYCVRNVLEEGEPTVVTREKPDAPSHSPPSFLPSPPSFPTC